MLGQPGAHPMSGQPGSLSLSGQPESHPTPGLLRSYFMSGQPGDLARLSLTSFQVSVSLSPHQTSLHGFSLHQAISLRLTPLIKEENAKKRQTQLYVREQGKRPVPRRNGQRTSLAKISLKSHKELLHSLLYTFICLQLRMDRSSTVRLCCVALVS